MWTDADRGYALAWQQLEDAKCPCGCGQPIDESTDPANEDAYQGHAVRCFAGQAREAALEAVDDRTALLGYVTRDDG